MKAAAGRWGRSESNGSDATLVADNQNIVGDISCDNISTINAALDNNSSLKAAGMMVLYHSRSPQIKLSPSIPLI